MWSVRFARRPRLAAVRGVSEALHELLVRAELPHVHRRTPTRERRLQTRLSRRLLQQGPGLVSTGQQRAAGGSRGLRELQILRLTGPQIQKLEGPLKM